jgi:uncharacterized protein YjdB
MKTGEENPLKLMELNMFANDPGFDFFVDDSIPGRVYTFEAASGGGGWFTGLKPAYGDYSLSISDDHGATTRTSYTVSNTICSAIAISPGNRDIVLAGFFDDLKKIDFADPGGASGISLPLPGLPSPEGRSLLITGIHAFSDNPGHILVTRDNSVYITEDETEWTKITTGLEALGMYDIIFKLVQNPLNNQQLTLATNRGIFTSLDEGLTWARIYDGLIHNIAHSSRYDGQIVAVTHSSDTSDFGIIYTKDGGTNWYKGETKGLYYIVGNSSDFKFTENTIEVYAGSGDLGLVKYTLAFTGGVSLDNHAVDLVLGETEAVQLTATVYPAGATNKNVTWSSSDETVASVENGLVRAWKEGTATITVTTEEGAHSDNAVITVTKFNRLDQPDAAPRLYPNPAKAGGMLNIALPAGTEGTDVSIYDAHGRLVARQNAENNTIALPNQTGLFIVKILTPAGRQYLQKISVK